MPYIQLQFRRDTSVNWAMTNPLLASGEMGIELDTHTFKIGDGFTRWVQLPYGGLQGPAGPPGLIPPTATVPGQVLTYIGPSSTDISWTNPLSSSMIRNYVIIKAPKSDVNFDFGNASLTISPGFGYVDPTGKNPYIPGIIIPPAVIPTGTTDTTGFSIMLNSRYNMMNPPVIVGTISYWDGQKLTYMQIKFGNSSTSQSIRATVIPENILNRDSNNKPTYGSPLQLKVDGISSSIFNGITNVSYQQQALYSIVIYIEIIN